VAAIWAEGDGSWIQLDPAGFPNEASLHHIVATSPELLPLSGSPRLVVLGREVLLGSGYADVLAIESTGRPVVIEVKLRNNSESRRAVVAQILAYASALHGLSHHELEQEILARHLHSQSLVDTVRASESAQEGIVSEAFAEELSASLRDGGFRLVLVLDQIPDELVTLVGYLESVTEALTIDLIAVSAYQINNQRIVVPQRIAPEPSRRSGTEAAPDPRPTATPARRGQVVSGSRPFTQAIENAPTEMRADLTRLAKLGAQTRSRRPRQRSDLLRQERRGNPEPSRVFRALGYVCPAGRPGRVCA
jgi:hypothetical protein